MTVETFSIGEAIRVGWREVTGALGVWLPVTLIAFAVSIVPDLIVEELGGWASPLGALVGVAGWLLYILVSLGFMDLSLRAVDQQPVTVGGLFGRGDCFVTYLLAFIIFGVAMALGLMLLIIPGLIVMVTWYFYGFAIVGERATTMESLQRSAALTKGHRVQVFLFLLALLGINILGALALVVGLLVTVPLSVVASAHVYRYLVAGLETAHEGSFRTDPEAASGPGEVPPSPDRA